MELITDRSFAEVAPLLARWQAREATAEEALLIILQHMYDSNETFRRAVRDPDTRPLAAAIFASTLNAYVRGVRHGEEGERA